MEWDVDVVGPTDYVHMVRRVTKHNPAVIGNRTEHRCARHDRRRIVGHRLSRRSRIWEARNCVKSVSKAAGDVHLLPSELTPYLSRLRRDSIGADFQSVRKLTNYVCAKPPESRLSAFCNTYKHSGDISVAEVADIKIT